LSDEDLIARAKLAKDVLDNPVYVESFDLIEKELFSAWKQAKTLEDAEDLRKFSKMLAKTKIVLESVIKKGEISQDKLNRKHNVLERAGQRLSQVFQG